MHIETYTRLHIDTSTPTGGFTLIEMMLGASIMAIVVVALLGSFFGQSFLNQNARNLTAAMNDATRIMEEIRQRNTAASCTNNFPSARPPDPYTSWNTWLNDQGKSVQVPTRNQFELVAVTCQDESGGTASGDYCGALPGYGISPQVGIDEWSDASGRGRQLIPTAFNPIRVTVAVGWLQQQRVIGQGSSGAEFTSTTVGCGKNCTTQTFQWGGDANNNGVIDSQAMLTTLVTCR